MLLLIIFVSIPALVLGGILVFCLREPRWVHLQARLPEKTPEEKERGRYRAAVYRCRAIQQGWLDTGKDNVLVLPAAPKPKPTHDGSPCSFGKQGDLVIPLPSGDGLTCDPDTPNIDSTPPIFLPRENPFFQLVRKVYKLT